MEKAQEGSEPIVSVDTQYLLLLLLLWKEEWDMFNNPYMTNLNLNDRIDSEIERLKQMKAQVQQPAPITQNFQLAPTSGIKYANTLDEVKKEMVYVDTPFFSKDFSIMWLKNAKGEVKNYELKEIVEKDEKDLKIEFLQAQINDLKKGIEKNEQSNSKYVDATIENEKPSNVSTYRTSTKKSK